MSLKLSSLRSRHTAAGRALSAIIRLMALCANPFHLIRGVSSPTSQGGTGESEYFLEVQTMLSGAHYLTSVRWAVLVTCGIGAPVPAFTDAEAVFEMMSVFIGLAMQTFFFGAVSPPPFQLHLDPGLSQPSPPPSPSPSPPPSPPPSPTPSPTPPPPPSPPPSPPPPPPPPPPFAWVAGCVGGAPDERQLRRKATED